MSVTQCAAAASIVAAAAFRGASQPLDSTFTYQGQLRNAGQLVNGNVDVRFTLWDSDVGGTQIGNANSFTNYPLTDGRFALGLNFGTGAFNRDQRWVQVEFRNPAGTGQYQALTPRDKITATPYALYALNGANGVWVYNTNEQAVTVTGKKVGIGTSNPTATLEVVDAVGGDDSVKLPAGSIGESEISFGLAAGGAVELEVNWLSPPPFVQTRMFFAPYDGYAVFCGQGAGGQCAKVLVDGVLISEDLGGPIVAVTPILAGMHAISLNCTGCPSGSGSPWGAFAQMTLVVVSKRIDFN